MTRACLKQALSVTSGLHLTAVKFANTAKEGANIPIDVHSWTRLTVSFFSEEMVSISWTPSCDQRTLEQSVRSKDPEETTNPLFQTRDSIKPAHQQIASVLLFLSGGAQEELSRDVDRSAQMKLLAKMLHCNV